MVLELVTRQMQTLDVLGIPDTHADVEELFPH
jgi:hypothetical protein